MHIVVVIPPSGPLSIVRVDEPDFIPAAIQSAIGSSQLTSHPASNGTVMFAAADGLEQGLPKNLLAAAYVDEPMFGDVAVIEFDDGVYQGLSEHDVSLLQEVADVVR